MRAYIVVAAIAVAALTGCNGGNEKNDAYGNFEAVEVVVSSEVNGLITSASVVEGNEVGVGQVLCTIDSLQNRLRIDQMQGMKEATQSKVGTIEAQIAVLQAQKQTADKDYARISAMLKDGAATQRDYDNVSGQLNVINRQIAQAKSQLAGIQGELKSLTSQESQVADLVTKSVVKSPIAGTILDKYIEKGELAVPGKQLYKIADTKTLVLKVYVSGSLLPKVVVGKKVAVYIDKDKKSDEKLEGVVTWVSPQAEFTPKIIQTKEERVDLVYAVKVNVPNDGRLKIGMPGSVVF
ncbi:HlyD family efflux transporter periplasmic adaptor subunit [uncultured Acetobacteroides sp.]|uniref:HlyD family secretion protein n=1 Tax=uncultured Acetobacteroides sp. TaxID=1760811 RepID=UPI0029F5226C|nr:HlyD family efflux transporter periplasmic adaptor subunit [uncultured Acetobacteroides sp.]